MKRPQPRGKNGQFVSRRPDQATKSAKEREHPTVVARRYAKKGLELEKSLFFEDRKLSLAIRQETEALAAELGSEVPPSARALISSIVLTRMRRDTMAAFVVELGPRAFNKSRREAYRIVAQLNDMERLLADLLRQFREFKAAHELEARIEALEDARIVR